MKIIQPFSRQSLGRYTPARIGLLDVGGATTEDVTRWRKWQDPDASGRGPDLREEETQGNDGKAYMYKLFRGPASILGVRERKRNHMGFEGIPNSLERGTPGFVPDTSAGRDLPVSSWETEIMRVLEPYDIHFDELPGPVRAAVRSHEAFTLLEGVDPTDSTPL